MRLLIFLLLLLLSTGPVHSASEAEWTADWCGARGLAHSGDDIHFKTKSGRSVYADCIGSSVVVEVDFARKYREGLMQATEYGLLSSRLPLLLLIVESARDCKYVSDAQWLMIRARIPMILTTVGHRCPRSGLES